MDGIRATYARPERERRFLLAAPPDPADVTTTRRTTDRYLTGTRLRLRRTERLDTGEVDLKFTQRIPVEGIAADRPVRGWNTNTYLDPDEYALLASLPAVTLTKTRLGVPPLGVDVFEGHLAGLVMAEVEFTCDEDCLAFVPPPRCRCEVTGDLRFTGGRLVRASRADLVSWLADYGLPPG